MQNSPGKQIEPKIAMFCLQCICTCELSDGQLEKREMRQERETGTGNQPCSTPNLQHAHSTIEHIVRSSMPHKQPSLVVCCDGVGRSKDAEKGI